MIELYRTCLGGEPQLAEPQASPKPAERSSDHPVASPLPFREWLFPDEFE